MATNKNAGGTSRAWGFLLRLVELLQGRADTVQHLSTSCRCHGRSWNASQNRKFRRVVPKHRSPTSSPYRSVPSAKATIYQGCVDYPRYTYSGKRTERKENPFSSPQARVSKQLNISPGKECFLHDMREDYLLV